MAVVTDIDLSKIKVKETASEVIKAKFGDVEQEFMIHALNDADYSCISPIFENELDNFKTTKLYTLLLAAGLDALHRDQAKALFLVTNCNAESVRVGNLIYSLTDRFYKSKREEAAEAEKNSEETSADSKPQEDTQA